MPLVACEMNQGGRFYELLDALKNEYETHTHLPEAHSKISREDYEIKSKYLAFKLCKYY